MLCALIMAGGKGTRFWPLSTEEKPKQFLNLIGNRTMIQMTVDRIKSMIPIERIFICTISKYVNVLKEQLPDILDDNIIIEPESRNTAPCIALSAFLIKRKFKNANMLVLPSDHFIEYENEFREIIKSANSFVNYNNKAIITLGMTPTRPETGYGYIEYGDNIQKVNNRDIISVNRFVEKPQLKQAKEYLRTNKYLWNAGIFLWNIDELLLKIKKNMSVTYNALRELENINDTEIKEYINVNYKKTESTSIDYALLEKADDIYVIPSDIKWDDIGSWKAVERYKDKDINDNITTDNVETIESKSNIAINIDKKVVMIGIKDIMTVETNDTIYIINKNYMDKLSGYRNLVWGRK